MEEIFVKSRAFLAMLTMCATVLSTSCGGGGGGTSDTNEANAVPQATQTASPIRLQIYSEDTLFAGESGQLKVVVFYTDGSQKGVTSESTILFQTGSPCVVDHSAIVTCSESGQVPVTARYRELSTESVLNIAALDAPQRHAFYGALHAHTSLSIDASTWGGSLSNLTMPTDGREG